MVKTEICVDKINIVHAVNIYPDYGILYCAFVT